MHVADKLPNAQRLGTMLLQLSILQGSGELELRHQRSPDVIVSAALEMGGTPDSVYKTIQTLLPDAGKLGQEGRPRLLEVVWGTAKRIPRPGWQIIHASSL